MSNDTQQYRHCEYQAAVAATVVSHKHSFIIVTAPTGSGKTWMQGLIAKYYCSKGQGVTIVEPNDTLRLQTLEKLGVVDPNIKVATIAQLYQYGTPHQLVILNEYDALVCEHPYHLLLSKLTGVWSFKEK